jgi:hypothetical protein
MKKLFFTLAVYGFIGSVSAIPPQEVNEGLSTPPRHERSPGPVIDDIDEESGLVEGTSLFTGDPRSFEILNPSSHNPLSTAMNSPVGVWELPTQIQANQPAAAAIPETDANNIPDQGALGSSEGESLFGSARRNPFPPENNSEGKRRRL